MKIAFIDTLGLTYDGSTLSKRGLGGSESAVIRMAHELAQIGFDVTVFNDCTSDESQSGIYHGVTYTPLEAATIAQTPFDVCIVSRSIRPYFESWYVCATARHKVLWMHDTFCEGDNEIENLIVQGKIDEIFTLSDWHTGYVTHADHGRRRNFDILKNHIFMTRNGIGNMNPGWIDVREKDPDLFVFNASVTKGMVPLVKQIWPKVKERIPQAKLKIVGGYYKFREASGPDQQQKDWTEMSLQHGKNIDFTGVITQQEISDILREASYMIYPVGFPETFGISTLEALAHNVPLITCRFGALEETAIDLASWKINYPVEPNWALPWLDQNSQVDIFVDAVVNAYNNKYLHQQKMYACNQVKDICTWDTVALQWKQHLYHKLGEYLPVDEYRKVTKINDKVRRVFNRRFLNKEEMRESCQSPFWPISIITPVYNAENYIVKCIASVAQQDYHNYVMHIIDDCSTDNTAQVAQEYIDSLPEDIRYNFVLHRNGENLGAVCNQVNTIEKECGHDIVMLLDGDDWLINDPNLFHKYNNLYNEGAEFTYGSCWSVVDSIPLIAQEYPPEVKKSKTYRDYKFNWNMPYTHLRTFKAHLMHDFLRANGNYAFRDEDGNWLKAGGDTAVFYSMIEAADPDNVVCVSDIVYNYNDANPLNDYKVNSTEQTKTATKVLNKIPKIKSKDYSAILQRLRELHDQRLLPQQHVDYLWKMKNTGVEPKVIYDIGACVLHWTNRAKQVWPNSKFIPIEAMEEVGELYAESGFDQYVAGCILSDKQEEVYFYENLEHPGGNSLFKENAQLSPRAEELFPETSKVKRTTQTLDNIVNIMNLPKPDLIKMDIQGAELSVLKGAHNTLTHCNHLILELQHVDYNFGAPKAQEVIEYLKTIGFNLVNDGMFCEGDLKVDGDYHFVKENKNTLKDDEQKFSVVVPTMWKCDQFKDTLQKLIDCDVVDEIMIYDNNPTAAFDLPESKKIVLLGTGKNDYVNPVWNECTKRAKNDYVLLLNDDIDFEMDIFEKVRPFVANTNNGVIGLCAGLEQFNQPVVTDGSIDIIVPPQGYHHFGFGCLMFVNKKNWKDIPKELKVYFGDYYIWDYCITQNKQPYIITNFAYTTKWAQTTGAIYNEISEMHEFEKKAYENILHDLHSGETREEVNITKNILIAIPCKNDIEADTFKSIYDLIIPEGYKAHFQYFYGYAVDQVRNLIAEWTIKGYDYLFAVDHDIVFAPDTLQKLLDAKKPIVSGIYRQRLEKQTIEVYDRDYRHLQYEDLHGKGLIEIGGCGFGCVLVQKEVFANLKYPHFVYHQALNHANTFSEDLDFCKKAREKGYTIWCDTSIVCGHVGQKIWLPELPKTEPEVSPQLARLRELRNMDLFPQDHVDYLKSLKKSGFNPKVIYDIGACVLHWTDKARTIWPDAKYVAFDAMDAAQLIYQEDGLAYACGVLGSEDNKEVDFWENTDNPGGNSVYKENIELSPLADQLYSKPVKKLTGKLDTVIKMFDFPTPDLIKMDVQGSELNVLKGATNTLKNCDHIILEMQSVDYNKGAPKVQEVIKYLNSIGFENKSGMFSGNDIDGDYHFVRKFRRQ